MKKFTPSSIGLPRKSSSGSFMTKRVNFFQANEARPVEKVEESEGVFCWSVNYIQKQK